MTQQTAVDWLVEKLNQCEPMYSGIKSNEHKNYLDALIEKARQMEKANIVNACGQFAKYPFNLNDFKQYYYETYGK